jgi:hypothetical protein
MVRHIAEFAKSAPCPEITEMLRLLLPVVLVLAAGRMSVLAAEPSALPTPKLTALEAKALGNVRQVTFGLPRAGEGYFSPDGMSIVYQAYPVGYPFYQIYTQSLEKGEPRLVSTGRGRTTCSYFSPDAKTILFASSHTDPAIEETEFKAREEAARGGRRRYQWDFDPNMDIYTIGIDGRGLKRLTDAPGYDAEGSYSSDGKQIVRRATATRTSTSWMPTAATCGSSRMPPDTTAGRSSRPTTNGSSSAATVRRSTCCRSSRSRRTGKPKCS